MVPYMIPLQGFDVREYLDQSGRSPFAAWSDGLNREAAVGLIRLQQGHQSMAKGIGPGLYEYRIDFGPGYRIYFGRDGERLVILLGGGTKKRQQQDIKTALARWADYKLRRPKER
jgi:putative addiction module killer protein